MNFPPPPSFNDPQLFPPPPSSSSALRQSQAAPSRDQQATAPSHQQQSQQQQQQQQQHQQQQQQPALQQQQQQQQQQYHQQQQLVLMNGLNGGNMPGAMIGIPAPAGHQSELTYIYGMVEELSRQLAENKRALEEVVAGVGRVRSRARAQVLGSDDLIAAAADDVNCTSGSSVTSPPRPSLAPPLTLFHPAQEQNLDALVSLLSEALEKANYSREANAALLSQYASVMSTMLKQFHEYKAKHVADVASWHRSYRTQLAEARAENSRLREQIWEMQGHAGHANEILREFRAKHDEDAARWERRVDAKAVRQELRFWKRMAMPEMSDSDSYWSDDDDLIDPVEKQRLRDLESRAAQEQLVNGTGAMSDQESGEEGEGGQQELSLASLIGGVAMQREDSSSSGSGMPLPPPRPSSASSTGSSGQ